MVNTTQSDTIQYLSQIPLTVRQLVDQFHDAGFEAYIVGGCVRDLLNGKTPSDWDVATNANPEQITTLFPDSYSDNKFGTVTVRMGIPHNPNYLEIEVTPYRIESQYHDQRHPDTVKWADNLATDLSRRDFTINAIALRYLREDHHYKIEIVDLYYGQDDLKEKIIRAVGNPQERFQEDALRMMRAARFAITLGDGWRIDPDTESAIKANSSLLEKISWERIHDELIKIIMSPRAAQGIELLRHLNLLSYIMPELLEGYKVEQNKHHLFDCYWHSLKALEFTAQKNFNLQVRMAALLHDIGKPRAKRGNGPEATFYNHEIIGAQIAQKILTRLRFSNKDIEKIVRLVRYHLFYYNVGEVSEAAVRRLVRNVGPENIEELLQVRMADRIGSGCPKAEPYKLRHLRYLMEKAAQEPISPGMLKVNGKDIMDILKINPGPRIGNILQILLAQVLEDPAKNNLNYLQQEIKKLGNLSESELSIAAIAAQKQINEIEIKRDQMTKKKYWVT